MRHCGAWLASFSSLLIAAAWSSPAPAITYNTLALHGDAVPGATGVFTNFYYAHSSATGRVAAEAQWNDGGPDRYGLFRHQDGTLQKIVHYGDPVPEGGGQFQSTGDGFPKINAAGDVAWYAFLGGTPGGNSDARGIYYRGTVVGDPIINIARANQFEPGGNGRFSAFSAIQLSDAGHISFRAILTNTSGGASDSIANYLHTGGGPIQTLARLGAPSPDGDGTYSFVSEASMGDGGMIAWRGLLQGASGGAASDRALYRHDGVATSVIARENDLVPSGDGRFEDFAGNAPFVGGGGHIAFGAFLRNTAGGANSNFGVYLHDNAMLHEIAREGVAMPDGNGVMASSLDFLALNGVGQVLIPVIFRNNVGGASTDTGLYRAAVGQGFMKIMRENDVVPDGNGRFDSITNVNLLSSINSLGQAAFMADLRNTSGGTLDNKGIYATDPAGALFKIVRKGDLFDVDPTAQTDLRTVADMLFVGSLGGSGGLSGRSIADDGTITFSLTFTDGTAGLFTALIPEPATALLLAPVFVAIVRRRASRHTG